MTLKEVWEYGNQKELQTLKALVEMLVMEKKVCSWGDDWEEARPYLQERYIKAVGFHLERYMKKQGLM